MDDAVHIFIKSFLKGQQAQSRISSPIFTKYNIVLPDSAISQYRKQLMNSLMMETSEHPRGTAVDRLVAESPKQDNISYLYGSHDM